MDLSEAQNIHRICGGDVGGKLRLLMEYTDHPDDVADPWYKDIKIAFPNAKGYSVRNLKYMAKFVMTYPDRQFVQTVSAQIPWSHNVAILDKVKDPGQWVWYIQKTAENGWSHSVLIHQIESGLYERQVIAEKISNFESRLPTPQSELAIQTIKDPYIFDFIPFKEDIYRFIRDRRYGNTRHVLMDMLSIVNARNKKPVFKRS